MHNGLSTKAEGLLTKVRATTPLAVQPGDSTTLLQMSTTKTAQTPLFCVLDEAQYAATQHNSSFCSNQNGSYCPILHEIVKAWEGQSFGQRSFYGRCWYRYFERYRGPSNGFGYHERFSILMVFEYRRFRSSGCSNTVLTKIPSPKPSANRSRGAIA